MKLISKLMVAIMAVLFSAFLQAHEGHARVGSMAHELEHAGWLAGAFMIGLVLIIMVFRISAGASASSDNQDKKRRS